MTERPPAASPPRLDEQLADAMGRVDDMTRQLQRTREEAADWRAQLNALRETLQTVDGRTLRHEVAQDAMQELRQAVGDLREQFEQESALRRDQSSGLVQGIEVDRGERRSAATVLDEVLQRVETIEQRVSAAERVRERVTEELGDTRHGEQDVRARLEAIESRTAADRDALHSLAADAAVLGSSLPELVAAVRELDTRTRETQIDQRRGGDSISALQAERGRESQLLDAIERQRAARQSLDERVARFDEELEAMRRRLAEASQERALLRQHAAGLDERVAALREAIEAQRVAVVEHFSLLARASEEARRRQVEEMERSNQRGRDLQTRLVERSAEASQEQPL